MPLFEGYSRKAKEKNIETELSAGVPRKQAIAIALEVARRAKQKAGQ